MYNGLKEFLGFFFFKLMYYDFEKNRINFFHMYRGLLKFYYLLIVLFYNYNFLKDYIIRIALLI